MLRSPGTTFKAIILILSAERSENPKEKYQDPRLLPGTAFGAT